MVVDLRTHIVYNFFIFFMSRRFRNKKNNKISNTLIILKKTIVRVCVEIMKPIVANLQFNESKDA